jgi:hypothetical protein
LKANGRIRTDNHWFTKPEKENRKPPKDKALSESSKSVCATSGAICLQNHPDLQQLIEAWPELSEHVKEAIKILIEKHTKGRE